MNKEEMKGFERPSLIYSEGRKSLVRKLEGGDQVDCYDDSYWVLKGRLGGFMLYTPNSSKPVRYDYTPYMERAFSLEIFMTFSLVHSPPRKLATKSAVQGIIAV